MPYLPLYLLLLVTGLSPHQAVEEGPVMVLRSCVCSEEAAGGELRDMGIVTMKTRQP